MAAVLPIGGAASAPLAPSPAQVAGSFARALRHALGRVNQDLLAAQRQEVLLASGQGNLEATVVAALQASSDISLVAAVRDRAIAAYQELMNLQV